jgi:LysR family transcriptional activator of dmlA
LFHLVNRSWDLADLDVFCAVVKRSSFTGAAKELGLSPAYVTKRVAGLEQALGARLFHRTTRRVNISPAGEATYAWARKIVEAADGLTDELAAAKGVPTGKLRISASLHLGRSHVAPILAQLVEQHPTLGVWLELVDRRIDLIAEGFDIDIRVGEGNEPHLVTHLLTECNRVLCAAPSYLARRGQPQTLADLAQHDCLLFRDREDAFGVLRMEGPNGIETVKVLSQMCSNHSDPVLSWALSGHGIMLASVWAVATHLRGGALQPVLPQYRQQADIYAAMPARASNSAKVRVCLDYLFEQLRHGPFALDTTAT